MNWVLSFLFRMPGLVLLNHLMTHAGYDGFWAYVAAAVGLMFTFDTARDFEKAAL